MSKSRYTADHPVSLIAAEFGYKNAASAQASMHARGYQGGWGDVELLRAWLNAQRAGKKLPAAPKGPALQAHARKHSTPAMLELAAELFPDLAHNYRREKLRRLLRDAAYTGALTDKQAMTKALGITPKLPARAPQVIEGEAHPVADHRHARLLFEEVAKEYNHQVQARKRRADDPLLNLMMYAIGVFKGAAGA